MKRLMPLLTLLTLAGCSTTSNDVTQNLKSLPTDAVSWQCDSGNRLIVQPYQDGTAGLHYRDDTIKMTERSNETGTVLEGAGLTWRVHNLYAELSGTYTEDGKAYNERCTQVLQPDNKVK